MGPLFLTPRLRVQTLGFDSNVFYTSTDRRTDFVAAGGPGLTVVAPMRSLRLTLDGGLTYTYFAKTESQRRMGGDARGRLAWNPGRVDAGIEEFYARTFQRPNFEVDRRVLEDRWGTRGNLGVKAVGRFGFDVSGSVMRVSVTDDEDYFGADLAGAYSRDEGLALLQLKLGLTPKTFLLVAGDYQQDRFTTDASRDADSNRLYAGFQIESETRLSGTAVGGLRLYRPADPARGPSFKVPYANVSLSYQSGPRTNIGGRFSNELQNSAFEVADAANTLEYEVAELSLRQRLVGRFELRAFGRRTRQQTRGEITVVDSTGETTTGLRDDVAWEGETDLGYIFRNHVRVGVALRYTERQSTFADFGIEGLLLGATVFYVP